MVTPSDILNRGVVEIIDKANLEKRLQEKTKLIIKLGIDPTSPDLHLGHSIVILKLAQFQQLGHQVVLVIGDFTAAVGDPSGRDTQRPVLTPAEIEKNLADYQKQAGKILDMTQVKVVRNSSWFKKIGVAGLFELMSRATINQLIERKDFKDRLSNDTSLTYLETLYPLLQGYDSVEIKADVEIGGTDQLFNLLMGRQLQKRYGQGQQDVVMTPLLVGLDGKNKMSKSLGNYIGLSEDPQAMFGKIMSVPDELIKTYFELLTDFGTPEIEEINARGPYEAKKTLGEKIVLMYHGKTESAQAREEFERVFSKKEEPVKIEPIQVDPQPTNYLSLTSIAFGISRAEARRLIVQGALEDSGRKILDPETEVTPHLGQVLKLGKQRFKKVEVS